MGNSLLDQLKKSGLVDEKQAQQAAKQKHKQKKQQRHKKPEVNDLASNGIEKQRAEKVRRDRELNRQRNEEAHKKAIAAQIKQLIETTRIADRDGETPYNFSDGKKVRRLYLVDGIRQRIIAGQLAIVKLDDQYELVPGDAAEKIKTRDATFVVVWNRDQTGDDSGQDDPYADHVVPDDLMW